jgi:deoxyribodipyrimidine photo-lyase
MSNVYQLIWFRQDLRIHDHAALWHARQMVHVSRFVFIT